MEQIPPQQQSQPLTEEQQQDISTRIEEFRKRYNANIEELQVAFTSFPQFVQLTEEVFGAYAGLHMIDKKYAPVPSPIQAEDVAAGEDKEVIEE